MFITGYKGSGNIGDAIQTIAIMQWLEDIEGYYWRETAYQLEGAQYLVNGWWGYSSQPIPKGSTCVGVHANYWTLKDRNPIYFGARDHWSHYSFLSLDTGIFSWLSGCWSLSFPQYYGPRKGRYSVCESPPPEGYEVISHGIWQDLGWRDYLYQSIKLLRMYMQAEHIITNRLHCYLPAKAFGTPCNFKPPNSSWERFSAIDIPFNIHSSVHLNVRQKPRTLEEIEILIGKLPSPR